MDVELTRWINGFAGHAGPADVAMVTISNYGVPVMVLAVVLQWWARRNRPPLRHAAVNAGLSFLLGLGLNQVILLFVHRARPYDAGVTHPLLPPSADWSFPSDHATASVAIVAAIAMQHLPARTLALGLLAALICLSRIYVGTHYVTDVIGGAGTAVIAALIVRWLYAEDSRLDRAITSIL